MRVIKVKDQEASEPSSGFDFEVGEEGEEGTKRPSQATTSAAVGTTAAKKSTKAAAKSAKGWTTKTAVTRSGAGCRSHATRHIRQRHILHQPLEPPNVEPAQVYSHPHRPSQDPADPELGFPFISQTMLLYCVAFRLVVYIISINTSSHTEHVETVVIPLTVIPPPFQGPSTSNATRLPTFLEAESGIYTSSQTKSEKVARPSRQLVIPEEGVQFGFGIADQFDGHMAKLEERAKIPSNVVDEELSYVRFRSFNPSTFASRMFGGPTSKSLPADSFHQCCDSTLTNSSFHDPHATEASDRYYDTLDPSIPGQPPQQCRRSSS